MDRWLDVYFLADSPAGALGLIGLLR
jgi:hypothetical protein